MHHTPSAASSSVGEWRPAVLALGANLGEPLSTVRQAVKELMGWPGIRVRAVSRAYRSKPVGGPPDQPDYCNAVLTLLTQLTPRELLECARHIEQRHHRERIVRWGPRTLDIDIIAYGNLISDDSELTLPHPRAHERHFVLVPWLEIDPDAVLDISGNQIPIAEAVTWLDGADELVPGDLLVPANE